jgi:Outer membrane protein beta-barrel domain
MYMKKITILIAMLICFNSWAQNKTKSKNEDDDQAVKKGNVIIDGFYGFPNLFKSLFRAVYKESNKNGNSVDSYSIIGIGPVGGNVQYMLEDNIGLLLEGNYMDFGVNWQDKVNANAYNYSVKIKLIRAMVGGEYHFGANDKLDAFAGAKVGLNIAAGSFNSNDPDFRAVNYSFSNYKSGVGFSTRLYAGVRYFPIKPLGLFLEGGFFGGGIVRGGISVKL